MKRLENKVAIVTGGASGMGENLVELFSAEGATVIAADINEDALESANNKDNVIGMILEVSCDEERKILTKEIIERYGKIDILVNNTGISSEKTFKDITVDDWNLMMKINSFGPFAGIKHIAPYMAEQ